jgi:hypothetical protein
MYWSLVRFCAFDVTAAQNIKTIKNSFLVIFLLIIYVKIIKTEEMASINDAAVEIKRQ